MDEFSIFTHYIWFWCNQLYIDMSSGFIWLMKWEGMADFAPYLDALASFILLSFKVASMLVLPLVGNREALVLWNSVILKMLLRPSNKWTIKSLVGVKYQLSLLRKIERLPRRCVWMQELGMNQNLIFQEIASFPDMIIVAQWKIYYCVGHFLLNIWLFACTSGRYNGGGHRRRSLSRSPRRRYRC